MAIFVFLSGYFTHIDKVQNDYKNHLIIGGRLLVPFLLWSMFYSAVGVARMFVKGEGINWWHVIVYIVTGKAAEPFYYIMVLLQLTILAPVLIKAVQEKGTLFKMLWWLTPAYLLFIYYSNIVNNGIFDEFGTLFVGNLQFC